MLTEFPCRMGMAPSKKKWVLSESYGEAPVLEMWGIWTTLSLLLLLGQLCPSKKVNIRIPSSGQIDIFKNDLCSIGILDKISL